MYIMHLIDAHSKVGMIAFMLATTSLIEISSQSTEFTVVPRNISVPLHLTLNVTFECAVSTSLRSHWIVKFPDIMQNLSTRDSSDMPILIARGIFYTSSRITIPAVARNNCTLIRCAVFNFVDGLTEFSDPVKLTIVGPPLPPAPILVIRCPSQVEVQWETPYSPENFTVDSYNIEVVNQTSGEVVVSVMKQNETSHLIVLDGVDQVMTCDLLTISVTAVSVVGESEAGMVIGGFPIAPQPFESEVAVDLTFRRDGSPIAQVNFEAPFICDFQTSNYTVTIEDTGVTLLTRQSTFTGSTRSVVEIFDMGLITNHNYTITISVEDEYFDGIIMSNTTKFSTSFEPTTRGTSGLGLDDIGTYAGTSGAILIIILISVTLIATTIVCSRKRKNKAAPGTAMDRILYHNNNRADQVDNDFIVVQPIKREGTGHGSVYETINEYQEARKNAMGSQQQQDYQWKLQQLELVESERDALEESAYQVMSSAQSTGDISDSAGIPASHFSYPQPYYINNPQSPNNPPSLTIQHRQFEAAPDNDISPTHNSGYQFRACPVGGTAAGSSLSPIHEAHYNSNDPGVYAKTYRLGGTDEYDTKSDSMEEGYEDYTFMSRAGTLAIQTSVTCHQNRDQYCSKV